MANATSSVTTARVGLATACSAVPSRSRESKIPLLSATCAVTPRAAAASTYPLPVSGAYRAGVIERQAVEVEAVLVAGRRRPGADPHRGQPHQPVERRRGQVDGADPLESHRQQVAVEQPATQLDPLVVEPVGGREVAQ